MKAWYRFSRFIRERSDSRVLILLFPALFWLIFFFLVPIASIFIYSFAERGTYGGVDWALTLGNYRRLLDSLYLGILWRSILTAAVSTVICLFLGYPFAYYVARYQYRWRNVLLLLVVLPFWTNFLIRTYAWIVILRAEGVLNKLLVALFPDITPPELLYTPVAVHIGLI